MVEDKKEVKINFKDLDNKPKKTKEELEQNSSDALDLILNFGRAVSLFFISFIIYIYGLVMKPDILNMNIWINMLATGIVLYNIRPVFIAGIDLARKYTIDIKKIDDEMDKVTSKLDEDNLHDRIEKLNNERYEKEQEYKYKRIQHKLKRYSKLPLIGKFFNNILVKHEKKNPQDMHIWFFNDLEIQQIINKGIGGMFKVDNPELLRLGGNYIKKNIRNKRINAIFKIWVMGSVFSMVPMSEWVSVFKSGLYGSFIIISILTGTYLSAATFARFGYCKHMTQKIAIAKKL